MHRALSPFATFILAALAALIAPEAASASSADKAPRLAPQSGEPRACAKAPVEVVAGSDSATFVLAQCDGRAMTSGIDQLSLLARPAGARSSDAAAATATPKSGEIGLGAGRVDPAIVERVEVVVDHFRRPGQVARIVLVPGSRHHGSARRRPTGNTIDFRIDGVKSEALAAFCKTLPETACRYASNGPSGAFVHMGVTAVNASRATEADRPEPTESASTESASPADDTTSTSTPPAAMMVQSAGSTAAPERQGKLPALPSRERPARHRPRAVKAHTEQYFL